jgi:site-specific DNA-cytosine methylase
MVFETVCTDLESEGYEVQPFIIPAAGVGAPHRRERVWIVAHLENSDSRGRGWQERFRTHDLRRSESKEQNNNFDKTSEGRSQGNIKSTRSNVVDTISNDKGREISRGDEETRGIQEEHRTEHSTTRKSSRTSEVRNGDDGYENMENPNNNGLEGRLSKTRNEIITGKESSVNGSENTNLSSRRSDGGGDQSQPRIDGAVQGLRDGNEEELTRATGVRGLHERADNSHDFNRENRHQENNSRALVQKGQTRVQSSISGRLATDQTTLGNNQIRQRDDNATLDRVENGHEDVENPRRTLRSRGELGAADEDETRKENADQLERSSSTSESNVADTESIESNVRGLEQRQRERSRQGEVGGASGSTQGSQNWWLVEPNVGRVAHGVSGRVHRLKGLGNSIVPQIAEEIGRAIIKAEHEME